VRYLAVARPGAVPVGNHESLDLRWATYDELPGLGADDGLLRLARAAQAALAELPDLPWTRRPGSRRGQPGSGREDDVHASVGVTFTRRWA
jgi:hypothetical protein